MRKLHCLTLLALVAACGGVSDPDQGQFRLVSVNDHSLPWAPTDFCCAFKSGSIELSGDSYRIVIGLSNKDGAGSSFIGGGGASGADAVFTGQEVGTYEIDNGDLSFSPTASTIPDLEVSSGTKSEADFLKVQVRIVEQPGTENDFELSFTRRP